VAKRTAKQIERDGRPVPMWPSSGYLYSYRCIGKVGNLLASATANRDRPASFSTPRKPETNSHKYKKLVQSAARKRFIAYEFSDLSIAHTGPFLSNCAPPRPGPWSLMPMSMPRLFPGINSVNHPSGWLRPRNTGSIRDRVQRQVAPLSASVR